MLPFPLEKMPEMFVEKNISSTKMLYQGPTESSPCRKQIIPYLFPNSFLNNDSQEASGLLHTPQREDVGWRWAQTKESVALM